MYLRTYVPTYLCTYVPTYLRTYLHTYLPTYVHTYIVKCSGVNPTQFVAELPRTSMEVAKVPRLPRKSSLRCRKCHACHAKDRGATSVLLRRQASADIYGGTESTTPATQIGPEVPKVPRLPRKRPRRHISPTSSPSFRRHLWWYRKYHACHANRA